MQRIELLESGSAPLHGDSEKISPIQLYAPPLAFVEHKEEGLFNPILV